MSEYKLTSGIIELSVAKTWDLARLEWVIDKIYEDSPTSCLCSHYPINEICVLRNKENGKTTIVGNCCVQKFIGLSSDKLFSALKRVRKNIENPLNADVVEYALENGFISQRERDFYIDTWRKRNLSEKQMAWRRSINQKILQKIKK